MAHVDKIIEKMKNQPNGIRMAEADKVLTAGGYRLDRQKGSHRQYVNNDGDVIHYQRRKTTKGSLCKRYSKPDIRRA